MEATNKVLGQSSPVITTLTDIYTVPAEKQAVLGTVAVANRHSSETTFRIAVAVAGAADNAKQYVAYDSPVEGNDTVAFSVGMTLGAGDVLRAYSGNGLLSFNVFGAELA